MKRTFELGNTIQFAAKFYNIKGLLTNVDTGTSPLITVTDSNGVNLINGLVMDNQSTGLYHYYWASTVTGNLVVKMTGTVDMRLQLIRKEFKVVETTTD